MGQGQGYDLGTRFFLNRVSVRVQVTRKMGYSAARLLPD